MAYTPPAAFVAGAILTAAQMNTLRSAPYGAVATPVRATANQSGISAAVDLTGLSISWTADATRTYKLTVCIPYIEQVTTSSFPVIMFTDSANNVKAQITQYLAAGAFGSGITLVSWETGLSGATTRKVRGYVIAGTFTIGASATQPMSFMVEDIGPT